MWKNLDSLSCELRKSNSRSVSKLRDSDAVRILNNTPNLTKLEVLDGSLLSQSLPTFISLLNALQNPHSLRYIAFSSFRYGNQAIPDFSSFFSSHDPSTLAKRLPNLRYLQLSSTSWKERWFCSFAKELPALQGVIVNRLPAQLELLSSIATWSSSRVGQRLEEYGLFKRSWWRTNPQQWIGDLALRFVTPLHYYCQLRPLDMVKTVVSLGFNDANVQCDADELMRATPLHCAVASGRDDVVEYLVKDLHADIELRCILRHGGTELDAVDLAAALHNTSVLKFLWARLSPHLRTRAKVYKLFYCCNNAVVCSPRVGGGGFKQLETFNALLDIVEVDLKCGLLDVVDVKSGRSLIFTGFFVDALDRFIEAGMSIHEVDKDGYTLLSVLSSFYLAATPRQNLMDNTNCLLRLLALGYKAPLPGSIDMYSIACLVTQLYRHSVRIDPALAKMGNYALQFGTSQDLRSHPDLVSYALQPGASPTLQTFRRMIELGVDLSRNSLWACQHLWFQLLTPIRKPYAPSVPDLVEKFICILESPASAALGEGMKHFFKMMGFAEFCGVLWRMDLRSPLRERMIVMAHACVATLVRSRFADALIPAARHVPCRADECADDLKVLRQEVIDGAIALWSSRWEPAVDEDAMAFLCT